METLVKLLQEPHFDWLPPHHVRQSLRAKRLQIRVSHRKGFEIILPRRVKLLDVTTFLQRKRYWIEKHYTFLSSHINNPYLEPPAAIKLLALEEHWHIQYFPTTERKKLSLVEQPHYVLSVLGNTDNTEIKQVFVKWLKEKATKTLPRWLEYISRETGLTYSQLRIKNQKTVWGSCSKQKTINLSIALLFLPSHLVRYVLIHELCHTIHLNHSLRFWQLVAKFDPNYQQHARETRKGRSYIPDYFM